MTSRQSDPTTPLPIQVLPKQPEHQRSRASTSIFSLRDILNEVIIGLTARPGRTILTALGTVLGVGALVTTLGLAKTAGSQIVSRFDELEATQVTVEAKERPGRSGSNQRGIALPWDAQDRLERLNGVSSAGTTSEVNTGESLLRSVPVNDPSGQTEFQVPLIAASPGLFDAAQSQLRTGRFFDQGHDDRADAVAVIGSGAAERLNITRVDNAPTIFVGEQPLTVIGILESTRREPSLLNAVIIPNQHAEQRYGLTSPTKLVIDVEIGAAELIADQAPVVLAPNNPDQLQAIAPPSPKGVKSSVESDVNSLFLVLGAVSLIVGGIGIANVTLVSVLERTGEIGLRRALGATRRHIATQFITESTALGLLAGLLGACLGVVAIVGVSASRQWTPVLEPWLPAAAPALGALIGLLAGTYPALKAATIEPIAALRGNN